MRAVEKYMTAAKGLPFFYVVGDGGYEKTLAELEQKGFLVDRTSDFCPKDDKFPSLDEIIDYFRTLDVNYRESGHVLIGLGEFLALRGADAAERELRRLKTTALGGARVVLLLRGVAPQMAEIAREDFRLAEQNRVLFEADTLCSLSITRVASLVGVGAAKGVQGLLRALEDGAVGNQCVCTQLPLSGALMTVTDLSTAYDAVKRAVGDLSLTEEAGSPAQWELLLQELSRNGGSLEKVFEAGGLDGGWEAELYQRCAGTEFQNWLFFLSLRQNLETIRNSYLQYAVSVTTRFDALKENILTGIIHIPRSDSRYQRFYEERKMLLKSFPDAEIALFIRENSVDPHESVYRLTDNTLLERKEILRWVAENGYTGEIDAIYPALGQYLKKYIFECGSLSEDLTAYFDEYKWQKVTNRIHPEFLERVTGHARRLYYARLESRDSVLLRVPNKESAFLYWVDALGVEYLSYMVELAKRRGLSIRIDIAHAALPTITSINRAFFDQWPGEKKEKDGTLDEIKHKEEGGYFYRPGEAPIHMAAELQAIERIMERAAIELAMHTCQSFIIASDHGASRLAVLHHQEEKVETDTRGERSGRCCKAFQGADLPYAIEENGYLALADYGRFKGSRAANVEVHGGASLEEVLVPVITLRLKKRTDVAVRLLHEDAIFADRHAGTTLSLYISDVTYPAGVHIEIDENQYPAVAQDAAHYTVSLPDIRRARKGVSASVFDGDDLIGGISFEIRSKAAVIKADFDELF